MHAYCMNIVVNVCSASICLLHDAVCTIFPKSKICALISVKSFLGRESDRVGDSGFRCTVPIERSRSDSSDQYGSAISFALSCCPNEGHKAAGMGHCHDAGK